MKKLISKIDFDYFSPKRVTIKKGSIIDYVGRSSYYKGGHIIKHGDKTISISNANYEMNFIDIQKNRDERIDKLIKGYKKNY